MISIEEQLIGLHQAEQNAHELIIEANRLWSARVEMIE